LAALQKEYTALQKKKEAIYSDYGKLKKKVKEYQKIKQNVDTILQKEKSGKVTESDSRYFLITKNPVDMKEILVDQGFVPGDVKEIIVGPANDRPGAVKLGNNQSITQEEAEAIEAIEKAGYKVKFQLLPDVSIGYWSDFKSKFGF